MARPTAEIAEYAMILWATEGLSFHQISDQIKARYGETFSPATVRGWKENRLPYDWEEWKKTYRARMTAKQIEEISDQALKARKYTYDLFNSLLHIQSNLLKRIIDGSEKLKPRSLESFMREVRETAKDYRELFADPAVLINELLKHLSDEEKAAIEGILILEQEGS